MDRRSPAGRQYRVIIILEKPEDHGAAPLEARARESAHDSLRTIRDSMRVHVQSGRLCRRRRPIEPLCVSCPYVRAHLINLTAAATAVAVGKARCVGRAGDIFGSLGLGCEQVGY